MAPTTRILIVCTGNSCRSQMAQGYLQSLDQNLIVFSAGTHPEEKVNPFAIQVMIEKNVDISQNKTNHIDDYISQPFDFVITVCDEANEVCPVFTGRVKQRIHLGFEDPVKASGSKEEILAQYRKIRDQIEVTFQEFYQNFISVYKETQINF